jgi:hypothetical protein
MKGHFLFFEAFVTGWIMGVEMSVLCPKYSAILTPNMLPPIGSTLVHYRLFIKHPVILIFSTILGPHGEL